MATKNTRKGEGKMTKDIYFDVSIMTPPQLFKKIIKFNKEKDKKEDGIIRLKNFKRFHPSGYEALFNLLNKHQYTHDKSNSNARISVNEYPEDLPPAIKHRLYTYSLKQGNNKGKMNKENQKEFNDLVEFFTTFCKSKFNIDVEVKVKKK